MKLASASIFPLLEDWVKNYPEKFQLRPIFESILSLQEQNLAFYLKNKISRRLFLNIVNVCNMNYVNRLVVKSKIFIQ